MEGVKKVLSNNWTITLVGILMGVLLGAYINGYFQLRAEKNETAKAFERILEELSENNERLIHWDSITKKYFICIVDMSKYVEKGSNGLIMSLTEKQTLLEKHSHILSMTDSIPISKNKDKYYWEMDFVIDLSDAMFPYNGIAWKSMKNSHYLKYIDFNCITEIEELHQTFEAAAEHKNKWFKLYLANILSVNRGKEVLLYWQFEREFNKKIIKSYPEIKKLLEECY